MKRIHVGMLSQLDALGGLRWNGFTLMGFTLGRWYRFYVGTGLRWKSGTRLGLDAVTLPSFYVVLVLRWYRFTVLRGDVGTGFTLSSFYVGTGLRVYG